MEQMRIKTENIYVQSKGHIMFDHQNPHSHLQSVFKRGRQKLKSPNSSDEHSETKTQNLLKGVTVNFKQTEQMDSLEG